MRLASLQSKRDSLDKQVDMSGNENTTGSASLLKRARDAEERVESLKSQLAQASSLSKSASSTAVGAKSGGAGGADPAEIKKLQKRIKELESSKGGGGGGGDSVGDKKAVAAAEKKFQKQMKEQETAFRKEKGVVEARAATAERDLDEANTKLVALTAERDKLAMKVKELSNTTAELDALRGRAALADDLAQQIQGKNAEIVLLTEQYKKEGALRKKYKNELEDLKGAIRVYARCRPFAKYELERGCEQVVKFVDDTALKVRGARGDKEFEFDAAFSPASTQDEVFEDTRRLIESFLDGFNVCLFAYGQTGSGA